MFYKVDNIREAIKNGIGYTPGITCNMEAIARFTRFTCVWTLWIKVY